MKTLLLAAALALTPAAAPPQDAAPAPAPVAAALPDADPALWVVRDEDTIVYLFGTFHLLDGRPWFNDEIKTAFDASGELVVEVRLPENLAEVQPLIRRYAIDPNGRTLSSRLTLAQNAALNRVLAESGVPAGALDGFEPWFMSMTLATIAGQRAGASAANGPETVLSQAARQRGVPIGELEGIEQQLQLLDGLPEEQQLAQLRDALDDIANLEQSLAPMLAAWSTGDVDALVAILNAELGDDPALYRVLFSNRNAAWAGWIQERMHRPGTVFIAVGAGHLAGRDSVQDYLAERGLRAERVPHAEDAAPAS